MFRHYFQLLLAQDGNLHCILVLHSKCLGIHRDIGTEMESQHIGHAHSLDFPCIGHRLDQTSLGDTHIHQEKYNFHECNSRRKRLQRTEFSFSYFKTTLVKLTRMTKHSCPSFFTNALERGFAKSILTTR